MKALAFLSISLFLTSAFAGMMGVDKPSARCANAATRYMSAVGHLDNVRLEAFRSAGVKIDLKFSAKNESSVEEVHIFKSEDQGSYEITLDAKDCTLVELEVKPKK